MTIGVFDSGVGGLSVLKHLKRELDHESFLYVADSGNAPYGDKTESFIKQRCINISDFIASYQVTAIVVACNTATAAAVELIRDRHDIPVVAVEPGIKPASLNTKTGKIGILATTSTLQSKSYKQLTNRFLQNVKCYEQAADGLVELVEAGLLDGKKTKDLLMKYLTPMMNEGIDTVVLGCTHYPFLLSAIKNVVGDKVDIVDTGAAIAEQLKNVLCEEKDIYKTNNKTDRYFTSADKIHSQEMMSMLLGYDVVVEKLVV